MRRLLMIVGSSVASCTGVWIASHQPTHAYSIQQFDDLGGVLESIVAEQAVAWNRGDIPGFMKAYWNDPRMTFSSGGKIERGWQPTLDRYRKNYPDQKAMGKLKFSELETTALGVDSALMLGRWRLEKDEPASGSFSLVWKKTLDGWRIVHDHTSSDKLPTGQ